MKKVDFENGKILQNILQTAFPMLVAQLLNLLYSIVDRIYIGRIPGAGTAALGAVGLCFPMIMIIHAFTNMFGMGGAPLFSIALGQGDRKKAGEVLNSSLRLLCVAAIVLTIVGELFGGPLLLLFGATTAELPTSLSYMRIYLIGTFFLMVSTGMNPYINAEGFATIGMITVTIGAVANLILDPIFIFLLGMGVEGAAIATVISQFLSFLFSLRFLLSKRNEYPLKRPYINKLTKTVNDGKSTDFGVKTESESGLFPYAKEIASLGTAPFIMQCTNSLVSIACNSVLMDFGGASFVSIMTIISSIRSILDTPVLAITEGASPIISFNYGAGRPDNVRKAIRIMMILAVPYTVLMWLGTKFAPGFFISIFSQDADILEDAIPALHLYFYAFIFQSLQYSGQTVFKALNKKKQAIFFSLFRKVVMVVPLTYLLPHLWNLGTDGVFIAEPVSNVIGGLACFITMTIMISRELRQM